ncbi:hypothetical protein QTO34_001638 [Cnephaeus nilssonii]|uniref:Zinc finger H2C2-type histone UAS binding domain-containing protein n=1 Tax=Cnephaeus nilssonii TaxID=3371016 RepID=A0AA40LLV0_CNENI|nr:hypothetical protein QTO34_001638 [Eptesicus nilssonii]
MDEGPGTPESFGHDSRKVIWAQGLGSRDTAQKAELIALTQALRWAKGRTERGLLTWGGGRGEEIKKVPEILALLAALWLPKAVAGIHCRGHQSADTPEVRGNAFADKTAKEAAPKPVGPLHILLALPAKVFEETPVYLETDNELGKRLEVKEASGGWRELPDTRLFIPEALGGSSFLSTHLGGTKLVGLLKRDYYIPKLFQVSKDIARRCHVCAQVNPGRHSPWAQGTRLRGRSPGEHLGSRLYRIAPGQGGYDTCWFLLTRCLVWPEAYPTKSEAAQIVVKKLSQKLSPVLAYLLRWGLTMAWHSLPTSLNYWQKYLTTSWSERLTETHPLGLHLHHLHSNQETSVVAEARAIIPGGQVDWTLHCCPQHPISGEGCGGKKVLDPSNSNQESGIRVPAGEMDHPAHQRPLKI